MGRRRSSAYVLQKRMKDTIRMLKLRKIKARTGLQCPKCYNLSMFIAEKGSLLVLIGCKVCNLGDLLPRHPTLRSIDLYHAVVDNWREGKIPEWKYDRLPERIYDFLQDNVTLGKIVCREIIEEEGDDEESNSTD